MNLSRKQGMALAVAAFSAQLMTPSAYAVDGEKTWTGFAELGSIWTSGNTDTSSINGKFEIVRSGENWKSKLRLDALSSEANGKTSKEKFTGLLQFDRSLTEHSYLAFVGKQERDKFSGFEYQGTAGLGYGYKWITTDTVKLATEIGPGYRRDKIDDTGRIDQEAIARFVIKYSWKIRPGVDFIEEFSADWGEKNSIYYSETGLKSQINGSLATKLTYKIKHVDSVPVDSEKTDTEFGVTLVYSF